MPAFLPLASNAGWFEREQLLPALALRIKVLLLLEQGLIVDDGAYRFEMGRDGAVEQALAPSSMTWDRSDMRFIGVDAAWRRIDFRPLFRGAEIENAPGIEWGQHALIPKVKRALRAEVDVLAQNPEVASTLSAMPHERDAIVKSWVYDSVLTHHYQAVSAVDVRAAVFVDAVNRAVAARIVKLGKHADGDLPARVAFSFTLPDLTAWSWQDIVMHRASASGHALRQLIGDVRLHLEGSSRDVSIQIDDEYQQRIDELTGPSQSPARTAVVCAVNATALLRVAGGDGESNGGAPSWMYLVHRTGV